jgi:hypothetical protein
VCGAQWNSGAGSESELEVELTVLGRSACEESGGV